MTRPGLQPKTSGLILNYPALWMMAVPNGLCWVGGHWSAAFNQTALYFQGLGPHFYAVGTANCGKPGYSSYGISQGGCSFFILRHFFLLRPWALKTPRESLWSYQLFSKLFSISSGMAKMTSAQNFLPCAFSMQTYKSSLRVFHNGLKSVFDSWH